MLEGHADSLAAHVPVIVETAWLIESRLGSAAEAAFLQAVSNNEVGRIDLTDSDWRRVVELIEAYNDLGLGTVDASIVAVAERLAITTVATLNQRDFRVVRPSHVAGVRTCPLTQASSTSRRPVGRPLVRTTLDGRASGR